jgi:arabinose-5-phosphate isomerase
MNSSGGMPKLNADRDTVLESFDRVLGLAQQGVLEFREAIQNTPLRDALAEAVAVIRAAGGRVIVTGVGKSGHIGRKVAATMSSTGTASYFVHPTEASHGDLGMVGESDVILALSWSGETRELADIITFAHRFSTPLIGITSNPDSTLARRATVAIVLPKIKEACPHGLAPTTSTMLQLIACDALAIALLDAKGFTADDFKILHPGGKLGAQLRTVKELMHTGDEVPLVPDDASFEAALAQMTAKGFGITGVVGTDGALRGVITDGDLRRHIGRAQPDSPVQDIMSRSPKHTTSEALAASALEMMETFRISALFVLEDGRPVGLLHLHDLLRAGVM